MGNMPRKRTRAEMTRDMERRRAEAAESAHYTSQILAIADTLDSEPEHPNGFLAAETMWML